MYGHLTLARLPLTSTIKPRFVAEDDWTLAGQPTKAA
jgi:hypothetical protein